MSLRTMTVVGALLLGLLTVVIVFVLRMRARSQRVLNAVRRVNRAIVNPRQMRSAGTPGAYASVIRHTGRTSGRPTGSTSPRSSRWRRLRSIFQPRICETTA